MPVTITESTSIDYDINGDGPPLLPISGLGFGRWGWFKQVPAFSRHFRTITFDTRGERRLENGVGDLVRDVVSLLDHLDVKKAHVFGASLGGFVEQELALLGPDLVDRLVLVCTSYGGRGPSRCLLRPCRTCLDGGSFLPRESSGGVSKRRPRGSIAPSTQMSSSRS
jgi:pimeloyl-ACP methyl ester carboxylesterase